MGERELRTQEHCNAADQEQVEQAHLRGPREPNRRCAPHLPPPAAGELTDRTQTAWELAGLGGGLRALRISAQVEELLG